MKLTFLATAAALAACGSTTSVPQDRPAPAPSADAGLAAASAFAVTGQVMVGDAPHGIGFAGDGTTAYVAVTGDDQVAAVDLERMAVTRRMAAGSAPAGIAVAGERIYVTQYEGDEIVELGGPDTTLGRRWTVGSGPSLFAPRAAGGRLAVVAERADVVALFDPAAGRIHARLATGRRPFPADVTRDGGLAVVPNRGDGTVSFVDLARGTSEALRVCREPLGGALTVDDAAYLLACGEGVLVVVDVAGRRVAGGVSGDVGARPAGVAVLGDGRHAVVTDAGGDSVAIVDLVERRVRERIRVGTRPTVARVHPDGRRVLVSSEISGTVTVLAPVD